MARRYDMSSREVAMRHTREGILDAAAELFGPAWYDEVTLADVARRAGVSQQTVVNHFGSKIQLYLAGLAERFVPEIEGIRSKAVPGDIRSIVDAVLTDYELTGDGTFRSIALAERVPDLRQVVQGGHRSHHEFVAHVFAPLLPARESASRRSRLRLLAAALDVRTWHGLRRGDGLDVEETREHLEALVRSVLAG